MATLEELQDRPGLVLVYDGACPLCASYVRMLRLRQSVGTVDLIDARSDPQLVQSCRARGFDLDDGMLATFGSALYYGDAAVTLLSTLTTSSGMMNRMTAKILRSPALARSLYPLMSRGRLALLWVLGRPRLG